MRRKQKMKEKEKRKEIKDYNRQQMMNRPQFDPLLNHDFQTIE